MEGYMDRQTDGWMDVWMMMMMTTIQYIIRNIADVQERQVGRKYLRSFIHYL
jgi:hypothetical protein